MREIKGEVQFRIAGLASNVDLANRFITFLAPDESDRVLHLAPESTEVYEFFSYTEGESADVLRALMLKALASMNLTGTEITKEPA